MTSMTTSLPFTPTIASSSAAVETISPILSTPSENAQQSFLMNETLREIQEEIDDSGRIAGIIIGVLGGLTIVISAVSLSILILYYVWLSTMCVNHHEVSCFISFTGF